MSIADSLQIAPAAHSSMTEVLTLVFGSFKPQDALIRVRATMEEFRAGKLAPGGLLEARRAGRLVGAVFVHVLRGRAATFWSPQLVPDEPEQTADTLMARAIQYTHDTGTAVIHAVLDGQPNPKDVERLQRSGFVPLAELFYLMAEIHDFPTSLPDSPLTFEPCTPQLHDRLCRVVEATYDATLDCPGLDGIRTATEVLEGYGASPTCCPPYWYLVQHGDRDVGCLLLADYADQGNCELTYMGLVPSARGNGWGLVVTRYAQWIARSLGRRRVVLAVDSTNQPARDMYAAAGFRGWDRRQVYMLVSPSRTLLKRKE